MSTTRKNSLIKKILLPITILGILLAPISPIFQKNNDGNLVVGVGVNKIQATGSSDFTASVTATGACNGVKLTAHITSTVNKAFTNLIPLYDSTADNEGSPFYWQVSDDPNFTTSILNSTDDLVYSRITWKNMGYIGSLKLGPLNSNDTTGTDPGLLSQTFDDLNSYSGKTLYARIAMVTINYGANDVYNITQQEAPFQTSADPSCTSVSTSTTTNQNILNFKCAVIGSGTVEGCVASLAYNVIFSVGSLIAEGAARFLDFFVYYSTNSTSYTNDFVTNAFAAVRDIANIFFIIALLYVAIKTILDIGVTNSKKTIGVIVIVALLINFSLFFTQIIIDSRPKQQNITSRSWRTNISFVGSS